jgi:hypothetical protein
MYSAESQPTFRRNISPLSSASKNKFCLSAALTLVSFSAYSTLKMKAICCCETSVESQRNTRRYISEDGTLHIPNKFEQAVTLVALTREVVGSTLGRGNDCPDDFSSFPPTLQAK